LFLAADGVKVSYWANCWEMTMARKPKKQRNEEQRLRQAEIREEAKEQKKPGRDDFARVLLWLMIRAAQKERDSRRALDLLRNKITDELENQGFNLKHSEDFFEDLAARYSTGLYPFRRKAHLMAEGDVTDVKGR
jgi:hypothetical protein